MSLDAITTLLNAVDDATEERDMETARRLLRRARTLARSSLEVALIDVRWAFVPDGRTAVDEKALEQALTVLSDHGEHEELARAYGAIGSLHMDREDPAGAADAYLLAEHAFEEIGDQSGVMRSQLNRAAALMSANRPRDAIALLDLIEDNAKRRSPPTLAQLGKRDDAAAAYRAALRYFDQAGLRLAADASKPGHPSHV
jgi:tetratricopeptide (TPR) repeat protein